MAGFNNFGGWNGYGNNYNQPYVNTPVNTWQQQSMQQPTQQPADYREFVHGRAGAEAYQLKPGVTMQVLWDDEADRFYVKGYDNNGRPRVLADNDFMPHVEPEPQQMQQIDLSPYATKEDIKNAISEAFAGIDIRPNMYGYVTVEQLDQALSGIDNRQNMNGYVTVEQLDQALSGLSVGNGGRIVRTNESNA